MIENQTDSGTLVNIKTLIAFLAADVDIFLTKNSDQVTDKPKLFTVQEIREQLMISNKKLCRVLEDAGIDINKPITTDSLDYIKNFNESNN